LICSAGFNIFCGLWKIVGRTLRKTLQQKVCQTLADFLSSRNSMKIFDREKLAKEMLTNILRSKNM